MNSSTEFTVSKHQIGYVSSTFFEHFKDREFEERPIPTFQKLTRNMSDAVIESELKPGICELGDVLAFLDNAPEECKDGWPNLFYTPSFVVDVRWDVVGWSVDAWYRDDDARGRGWDAGRRVFSPAGLSEPSPSVSSDTLTLAIQTVKEAGYVVLKQV